MGRASDRVTAGDKVDYETPETSPAEAVAGAPSVRAVYSDPDFEVLDKPAGVVVHPAPGHAGGTLVHGLVGVAAGGEDERRGIVHRLDRDTSGLLVVAKSDAAFERLQALVRTRGLDREYLALVKGEPRSRRGTLPSCGRPRRP